MLATMREFSLFFSLSPKRQRDLERVLSEAETTEKSDKQKLVDLCRTRWIEMHTAFETLTVLFRSVHVCLTEIEQGEG